MYNMAKNLHLGKTIIMKACLSSQIEYRIHSKRTRPCAGLCVCVRVYRERERERETYSLTLHHISPILKDILEKLP